MKFTARFLGVCAGLSLLFGLTPVWADHGAPAPQLGGVILCLEPSSVQLETEGIALSPAAAQRVRREIAEDLQRRLEAQNVPHTADCTSSNSYVLLSLYVRFLDPQTYVGFPKNSYTYVTTAQVGGFTADTTAETVLPESVYSASGSDIFQAATTERLEQHLIKLGETQAEGLVKTWLEANAVTLSSYLLFTALGLSFALLRVLSALLR